MQPLTKNDRQFVIDTAQRASEAIMKIYSQPFTVKQKADDSPLTQADLASNAIIIPALACRFPSHAILSEESKDDPSRLKNRYCWIVDPLDGTKEFIKKNGEFTVNIALAVDGNPVFGVIVCPCTKKVYVGMRSGGSYVQTKGCVTPLSVSDRTDALIMVTSRSHPSEKLEALLQKNKPRIRDVTAIGRSLKGCLIAAGQADVYYRFGYTMEWDTAAMHCIVEQAGGVLMNMDDTPMTYNRNNPLNDKGFYILNRIENRL